jgi:uncharacterized membrane protein YraQ (UPF0718 family)
MANLMAEFLATAWAVTAAMAPYLLLGFAVAGALSVWLSPAWIARHLGGRGLRPVLMSALCGIPLPLCSCSVLPVGASLRRAGAGPGALAAFLIATPQTGVDSLIVTGRLLSPAFAVFRVLAALLSGVVGGLLVAAFAPGKEMAREDSGSAAETQAGACHGTTTEPPGPEDADADAPSCCNHGEASSAPPSPAWRRAVRYGFATLVDDLALPLLAGIAVAALITLAVPPSWIDRWLGQGFLGMVAMMLLGIPMYICATGSVPVAAALLVKGASPGAALVFLMTGPATNAASLAALAKLLGVRATALYLAAVAGTALLAGFLLDATGHAARIRAAATCHPEALTPWEHAAAAVLIALIAASLVRRARRR